MLDLNKDSVLQGDNGSILRFTLRSNKELEGATVKVDIRHAGEIFTKDATIINVTKRICEVTLTNDDLTTAGIYFLQPTITFADTSEITSDIYRFAIVGTLTGIPAQPGNGGSGTNVRDSLINGNILVNGSEVVVYDDGQILQTIAILNRLGISANNRLIIDGIEQLGGGSEEMTLVVKDYFEGSANVTKTYTDSMIGFEISNDAASGGASLTFTINSITIVVKAGEVYSGNFAPYKTIVINTNVPYRAAVSASLNGTVTPPADTTAPIVTIAPNGGTFATTQQVTLTANETATIYYTLDGSTPTVSSTPYSAPITLSDTTTIKYFAKDTAGNSIAVQSATFTKDAEAPPDTTPPNDVTNLAYTNLTQTGVKLTWTASNSSDVSSYDVFNSSTNIGNTTGAFFDVSELTAGTNYTFTVKAKDGASNLSSGVSVNVTTTAIPSDTTAPIVTASPVAGTYTSTQSVTLSANETATIYYTTDGSTPTEASTVYSTPISISATSTVKYFGKDTAGNSSTVQSAAYTIGTAPSYINDASLLFYKDSPTNGETIPNADNYFTGTKQFTLSVTFKPVVSGANAANFLVSRFVIGGTENVMKTEFGWNNVITGNLYGTQADGTTAITPQITDPTARTDHSQYYHITYVRDSTKFYLYVNNVLVQSVNVSGDSLVRQTSSLPLIIGQSGRAGIFKNVAYYNRSLSSSELTQNYNALK